MMDATLWRMAERPTVEDAEGSHPATDAELLNMGVKPVGVAANGDQIVHVAPGTEVRPPGFTRIFNPGWDWSDVPEPLRDRVLEASYETEVDGETVVRRAKVADVPDGATVLETDQPPHRWAGDE